MRLKTIFTAALVTLLSLPALAQVTGTWTADKSNNGGIQLQMRFSANSNTGQSYKLAELEGLSGAQVDAANETPVTFALRREAGVVSYTGTFENGEGTGRFTFTPDRGYESRLRSAGVDLDGDELSDKKLFHLAIFDVSTRYVSDLNSVGFDRLDLDDVIGARIHRVSADLVREYRTLGLGSIDLAEAMALSIHRVTPEYIREMSRLGFKVDDPDDVVGMKIHRVTPEFINEMRSLGYTRLDADDFMAMRIHNVSPSFVRELKQLGYNDVSGDELVAMRIHRVTAEFIRDRNAAAGERLDIDELVEERIMGHRKHGKRKRN